MLYEIGAVAVTAEDADRTDLPLRRSDIAGCWPVRLPMAVRFFGNALLFLLLLTVFSKRLEAQSDLSSISGTITDPSGALVSGANVTLRGESTGATHGTTTNQSGFYTIPGLAPGKYTITVDAYGFQKLVSTGNNLDPSIPTTANLQLTLKGMTKQVQVQAEETTLQADSATLGRVITSNQVDNLPLNGRNPIYVALTKAVLRAVLPARLVQTAAARAVMSLASTSAQAWVRFRSMAGASATT